LAEIRLKLQNQTKEDPFSLSEIMSNGEKVSDFVVCVALNIHKKRTKGKKDFKDSAIH